MQRKQYKEKKGLQRAKFSAVMSVRHSRKRSAIMETVSRLWQQSKASARTITSHDTEPRNPRRGIPFPGATLIRWRDAGRERNLRTRARVGACHKHRPRATRAERFFSRLISLVRKTKVTCGVHAQLVWKIAGVWCKLISTLCLFTV